jgi:hypothetical protein
MFQLIKEAALKAFSNFQIFKFQLFTQAAFNLEKTFPILTPKLKPT